MNASYCTQIQSSLESIHHQGTLGALTALENGFAMETVGLPPAPAKELRPLIPYWLRTYSSIFR